MSQRTAATLEESWELPNRLEGVPHGWIQWKGTDACFDVRCECGELGHIDGEFAYAIKCASCGRVYAVGQHIELVLLDQAPDSYLVTS